MENMEVENLQKLNDSKFRLNRNYFILTYKTHVNKENLRTFLERKLMQSFSSWISLSDILIIISHEIGSSDSFTPYEHTHVYVGISNDKKIDTRNCRYFDYVVDSLSGDVVIHPHVQPVRNTEKDKIKSMKYVCKEDIELKDLHEKLQKQFDEITTKKYVSDSGSQNDEVNVMQVLSSCENFEDVLKNMYGFCCLSGKFDPTKMNQYVLLWRDILSQKFNSGEDYEPPKFTWQKWLDQFLKTYKLTLNYRKIMWFYDLIGDVGKTYFCEWMMQEFPSQTLLLNTTNSTFDNLMNLVNNALMSHWTDPKVVFINLPRGAEEHKTIYNLLEVFIDGRVCCTKYKGMNRKLPKIHVVVMANFKPKIFNEFGKPTLSLDRWDIRNIVKDLDNPEDYIAKVERVGEMKDASKIEADPEIAFLTKKLKKVCPCLEYVNDIWNEV